MKTEDEIINSISRSLNEITPNIYKDIKKDVKKERKMEKKKNSGWIFGSIATAITTFLLVLGVVYYTNNYVVDSKISIDVNPSIELMVSKSNKVLEANALNDGGTKILDNMDLKGVNLNIAVNALTGSMVKYGFLTGDDANVLVTVENDNNTKNTEIKTLVGDCINNSLKGYNVRAKVMNQIVNTEEKDNVIKLANDNNISYGKALFIYNLTLKDSSLIFSDLAKMSMREISNLIKTNNIDINDIVEQDDDDSIEERIEDTIEDINEEKSIDTTNLITKEKAINIALAHAKVESKNITVTLGKDDGLYVYEVEFSTDSKKYEYEINASTGAILDFDTDIIYQQGTAKNNPSNFIGETKAKEIAFKHANVTNPTLVKIVIDTERGIKVYDISFTENNYEYEYEINATTGDILDFDKGLDD